MANPWDPLHDLITLKDRMNTLFNETFARSQERPGGTEGAWSPPVDIYESEGEYVLTIELPGLRQDEIDLQIMDDVLTLQGQRTLDSVAEEDRYLRRERPYGRFRRAFSLPATVDSARTRATMKDGVLKVIVPKAAQTRPKSIQVNVE